MSVQELGLRRRELCGVNVRDGRRRDTWWALGGAKVPT